MNTKLSVLAVATSASLFTAPNPALAQSWTQTSAPIGNWHAIASSADGTKLVAVASGPGPIIISTNSGLTWLPTSVPMLDWFSVASSADGTKLVATARSARFIYSSADSGVSWTEATNDLSAYYLSCASSSADGNRMFAGLYD